MDARGNPLAAAPHPVRRFAAALGLLLAAGLAGCASGAYGYDEGIEGSDTLLLAPGEPQVTRGRPLPVLDGVGHYVISLPTKLILWEWDVDKHSISPETEAVLREYLADNHLGNVKVRLNEYSPGAEFRRLFRNRAVGALWRYTLGIMSVVNYTIMPGRLFGGDNYNPYTNTLNIYSDEPVILLHEGGHAKDFTARTWKGTYAALRLIPFAALWHEGVATDDAIRYCRDQVRRGDEKDAYKVLYPAFATYIAGDLGQLANLDWVEQYVLQAACVIPAHVIGRIQAAGVEDEPAPAGDP